MVDRLLYKKNFSDVLFSNFYPEVLLTVTAILKL